MPMPGPRVRHAFTSPRSTLPSSLSAAYIALFALTLLVGTNLVAKRMNAAIDAAAAHEEAIIATGADAFGTGASYVVVEQTSRGREEARAAAGDSHYARGTPAPASASTKEQIAALLNASVPIILDRAKVRAPRGAGSFSCGGTHVVKLRGYSAFSSLRNLTEVLPLQDPLGSTASRRGHRPLFESCAIVGNSGSLLEASLGDAIDAHRIVIRFNAGVTAGYEQFVGTRTSFRIYNRPAAAPLEPGEVTIATVRDANLRPWLRSALRALRSRGKASPGEAGDGGAGLGQANGPGEDPEEALLATYIFDPEFLCYCWGWVGNRGHKPSSGLVGVVLALKICRRATLFGFESSNYFSSTSRPHYFDWERPAKGRERVHPFSRELKLYKRLQEDGFLTIVETQNEA